MSKVLSGALIFVVTSMFIISCDKAPEQELNTAKAALDSAKLAGADKYLAADFLLAQDTLNAAVAEIKKQKEGNVISGDYDKARQLLSSATSFAHNLVTKASEQKAMIQTETDSSLNKADTLVSEIKDLISKLPKTRKNQQDSLIGVVTAIETSISEAKKAETDGNIIEARDKAVSKINMLDSLKSSLASLSVAKK